MPEAGLYVLDTNVLVTAHRSYYAFDIAPGFWSGLIQAANAGSVFSIRQVLDDLSRGHEPQNPDEPDVLKIWALEHFRPYFKKTDEEDVITAYSVIINWVFTRYYSIAACNEFAAISDSWLIAYAKAKNATVVTLENSLTKTSKVPIPAVCHHFGIPYINTFEMLRRIEITLT
jgi:hypothetical protein